MGSERESLGLSFSNIAQQPGSAGDAALWRTMAIGFFILALVVTLSGGDPIVPNDKGISSYVHTSLNLSFKILATIVMTLIVGLSALLPIAIILWLGFKLFKVMFGSEVESKPAPENPVEPEAPATSEPPANG